MKKLSTKILILISLFCVSALFIQNINNNEEILEYSIPMASEPHDVIQIFDNSDFTEANGVSSGDGSQGDPFIIENFEIDASSSNGIRIEGTNKYVIIRNCTITNGGTTNHGIWISNSEYITIENTTIQGNKNGILIEDSHEISIINNTIASNNENGISIISSTFTLVEKNIIEYNLHNGIYGVTYSHNTTVYNNTINNNAPDWTGVTLCNGIFFSRSDSVNISTNLITNHIRNAGIRIALTSKYVNIEHNFISYSQQPSIMFTDDVTDSNIINNTLALSDTDGISFGPRCLRNDIHNNVIINHGMSGMIIRSSLNTIYNNTVENNDDYGIRIEGSNFNKVQNNSVTLNGRHGIYIRFWESYAQQNLIGNNTITNNAWDGVCIEECNSNIIENNSIYGNGDNGISLDGSSLQTSNNIIGNNTIYENNNHGIFIYRSVHTTITNNSIFENTNNGIHSEMSSAYLDIVLNNITNHKNAIMMDTTNFAYVYNNTLSHFHDSFGAGVNLMNSHDSIIENNTISNTDFESAWNGIQFESSDRSLVSNNKIFDVDRGVHVLGSDLTVIQNNSLSNVYMGVGIFYGMSSGSDNTTIYSNIFDGCEKGIEISSGEYTNISHNLIKNGIKADSTSAGIRINHNSDANHTTIEYNQIINGDAYGIYIKAHHTVVMGNNISNNSEGIWMEYSLHNHILSNNISASNGTHGWGVYVKQSTNNTISSNTIFDNKYGIYLAYSNNNSIQSNNISFNEYSGIYFQVSNTSIVYDNDIHNNDYGIRFMEAKDNVIWFNSFWERGEFGRHIYIDSQFQNHFNHTDTENYRTEVNLGNYYDDYASMAHDGMVWETERDFFGKGMDYYPLVNKNRSVIPLSTPIIQVNTTITENGHITINWNDIENAAIYYIYRCVDEISSIDELEYTWYIGQTELLEFNDSYEINGTYYYYVVAMNQYINSEISNSKMVEFQIEEEQGEETNGDDPGDENPDDGTNDDDPIDGDPNEEDPNEEDPNDNGEDEGESGIPGYPYPFLVLISFSAIALILNKRKSTK